MPRLRGIFINHSIVSLAVTIVVIITAAAASPAPAFGVVIDDFTTGPTTVISGQSNTQSGQPSGSVIGGVRRITFGGVRTENGASPGSTTMTVDTTGGGGVFIVDGSPNVTPINSSLRYNGSTTLTSAMNVDLAPAAGGGGETGLALDFAYANFAPDDGNFDINLSSPSGSLSGFFHVPSSPAPFTLFIPFHATANTFDEHHVTSIFIGTSNGYWYNDFALAGIRSAAAPVPEPTLVSLAAAAAAPLLLSLPRRRRRAAAAHSAARRSDQPSLRRCGA